MIDGGSLCMSWRDGQNPIIPPHTTAAGAVAEADPCMSFQGDVTIPGDATINNSGETVMMDETPPFGRDDGP